MSRPWETLNPGLEAPHALREYALLADGERGILVGPRGDFAWMCFPRWDGDAVFSSLIGGRGAYAVTPAERSVWGGYYDEGTLIWNGRWVTESAIVESREALALPAEPDRAVILRRIAVLQGEVQVRVVLNLRAGFGSEPVSDLARGDTGAWTGRVGDRCWCWTGGGEAEVERDDDGGGALALTLTMMRGARHDLALVVDATGAPEPPNVERAWKATEVAWSEIVPPLEDTVGTRDARHAYAVLSGLTSQTGGMVAAATTSLPERAGKGGSYDYRYAWIRDQCYAGQAVAQAGPHPLLDGAVRFVADRLLSDGERLKPAYTTRGDDVPEERELDLPGYPGGTDVVGNRVAEQFQLDAFGEALLLLAAAARQDRLEPGGWRAVEIAADAIASRWMDPDAGVWELEPATWTHSRLTCAAGLWAVAECRPAGGRAAEWVALAERLTAHAWARCAHPSGRWQRTPDDQRLDASLLLPSLRGAIPASDPRTIATLHAVDRELTRDGYAYRFRPDDRPLGTAEGAFLLCGFLLSLAWWQQGEAVRAARWFERTRAASGPPGLLSEEFDVDQRQLRGNLPQGFVHALLLECAVAQAGEPAGRGSSN